MSLASPWALALAALAVPLVAAYLYRRHDARRTVPSAILLRAILDPRPPSRRARARLRHRASLALVALALAAGILALVGPGAGSTRATRTVIVLDRSASMATHDRDGERLARATDAAIELARGARAGDELALIALGDTPQIELLPTTRSADLVAAARALAGRGARGDHRDDARAFQLADALCGDPARARIVVISDGAGLAPPSTRCRIESIAIGAPADNLGISGLSLRPLDGLGAYDVRVEVASSAAAARPVEVASSAAAARPVEVASAAAAARPVEVALSAGDQSVDVVALEVPAGGTAERTVRVTIERGDALVASIAGGDALALDDRVEIALADVAPVSVLVITSHPRSLVAEALRLHPRVRLEITAPGALPTSPHDLIVVEDAPGGPLPPSPRVVALGVSLGDGAPIALGAPAADRAIVRWDFDAPWFRYVELRELAIARGRLVTGGRSIADTGAGSIAATAAWGDRALMVTGFAIDDTDLGLRAAFPNLIANLVDWAAPRAATAPARGVLSAAESQVGPRPLPGAPVAPPGGWDAAWIARIALLAAIAALLVEQARGLRGGRA